MNCRKVNHLLSAYMDGELPGIESLQIRDHLNSCQACCDDYNELLHMKRLLGRLKVQTPVHDLPVAIFQTIRVDSELASHRTVAARTQELANGLRAAVGPPRVVAIAICAAGLVVFTFASRNSDKVHSIGSWDHSTPPASEFTAGIRYPDPQRFVSTPSRNTPGIRTLDEVSFTGQSYRWPDDRLYSRRANTPVSTVDYTQFGR